VDAVLDAAGRLRGDRESSEEAGAVAAHRLNGLAVQVAKVDALSCPLGARLAPGGPPSRDVSVRPRWDETIHRTAWRRHAVVQRMIWNQTAYFGAGAVSVVPGELRSRGFAKALVVSTACWWAPASRAT
jgi:hypothetical protein